MEGKKEGKNYGRFFKLILKIVISVVCLWYVSTKINFSEALNALKKADFFFLIPALIAFVLSKIIAAIRLNIYFRDISVFLPAKQNIRLYWLGMFYNLFLPGSISGDAYKVVVLTKKFKSTYKRATSAVLLDRASGLLGLGLILASISFFVLADMFYAFLLMAGAILAVVATYLVIRYWMKDFIRSFFSTLLWGILVQACQVVCVLLIMRALNIETSIADYLFLFLVSSVVAILPLTIGGLGIREIVFLEGSKWLMLSEPHAVMISLVFYLITLITSAFGMLYVFVDPLRDEKMK